MTVLSHTTPKAKKEHRCDLCSRQVVVGDVYVRQDNMKDGSFYVWKTHVTCNAVLSKMYETKFIFDDEDEFQVERFDLFLKEVSEEQIAEILAALPGKEQVRFKILLGEARS